MKCWRTPFAGREKEYERIFGKNADERARAERAHRRRRSDYYSINVDSGDITDDTGKKHGNVYEDLWGEREGNSQRVMGDVPIRRWEPEQPQQKQAFREDVTHLCSVKLKSGYNIFDSWYAAPYRERFYMCRVLAKAKCGTVLVGYFSDIRDQRAIGFDRMQQSEFERVSDVAGSVDLRVYQK